MDKEFEKSRQVLAAKRKNLVQKAGKGNRPNATHSITDEEEDKLFQSGQFGSSSPEALQRTMWWFLSLHNGFGARDESRKLCWGDVELQQDPVQDGREMLVWLNERGTKRAKGKKMATSGRPGQRSTQQIQKDVPSNFTNFLKVTGQRK